MLRRAALASSVVASMPTVFPFTRPASASRCSIQVKTASCVFRSISRRAGNRRMVRRRLWQHQPEKTRAGQTNPPPRDRALGIQAFEIADQQQPEVAPGRQPWPSLVSVESLAGSLDELIKMVVVDDSIRARIEPVRGAPRQILCGQPHRRLSKAPWSFAHRHRRQCNRADRSCRSPITLTVHPGLLARQSQLEP
jgi:hypothetical protein